MADITIRLLWYRIQESSVHLNKVAEMLMQVVNAGGSTLNLIFLGWVVLGLLTLLFIALTQRNIQLSKEHTTIFKEKMITEKCASCELYGKQSAANNVEASSRNAIQDNGTFWSQFIIWITCNNYWASVFKDSLLSALTEESKQASGDLFMTFESVLPGSLAPAVEKVAISKLRDSSPQNIALEAVLEWIGVQFSVTVSDSSVSISSNLLLTLAKLRSKVNISVSTNSESDAKLSFLFSLKTIENLELQFSPYQQGIDCITDEGKLQKHVIEILHKIRLPLTVSIQPEEEKSSNSDKPLAATALGPPKPPRSISDKRLMIKLIKATSLTRRQIGTMDILCTVEIDQPLQMHASSVVKNTANPYWDEHFLFDLSTATRTVSFRIYNQAKEATEGCLGETGIEIERLRANQGIRLILPLEGRPGMNDCVSGSVTIESFFVDSAELDESGTEHDLEEEVFSHSVEPLAMPNLNDQPSQYGHELQVNRRTGSSSASLSDSPSIMVTTATPNKDHSYDSNFNLAELTLGGGKTEPSRLNGQAERALTEMLRESHAAIDLDDAEVIRVSSEQSVTDIVLRELQDRSGRGRGPGQTSTLIITALPRSDGSSNNSSRTKSASPPPDSPQPPERKSRLSNLKKRFTRTKDKKARSHSIERSSGIDEHRYLEVPSGTIAAVSSSSVSSGGTTKMTLGGSLRRLFHTKRNKSASRNSVHQDGPTPAEHSNRHNHEEGNTMQSSTLPRNVRQSSTS